MAIFHIFKLCKFWNKSEVTIVNSTLHKYWNNNLIIFMGETVEVKWVMRFGHSSNILKVYALSHHRCDVTFGIFGSMDYRWFFSNQKSELKSKRVKFTIWDRVQSDTVRNLLAHLVCGSFLVPNSILIRRVWFFYLSTCIDCSFIGTLTYIPRKTCFLFLYRRNCRISSCRIK